MDLINPLIHQIPTGSGFVVAFLVLALFVRKEMRRAWNGQDTPDAAEKAVPVRDRPSLENGLIGFLLGLYGLILLVRLLSFFP